jgi:hypothetical protein
MLHFLSAAYNANQVTFFLSKIHYWLFFPDLHMYLPHLTATLKPFSIHYNMLYLKKVSWKKGNEMNFRQQQQKFKYHYVKHGSHRVSQVPVPNRQEWPWSQSNSPSASDFADKMKWIYHSVFPKGRHFSCSRPTKILCCLKIWSQNYVKICDKE